jgi:hypothetical protein
MLRSALRSLVLAIALALALASTALAVDPTVTTLGPSQLQPTQTHFTGTINAEGNDITALRFEWGTTTAYGQTADTNAALPILGSANLGTVAVRTAALITNLTPATVYHYRLVAQSGATVFEGPDIEFTTPTTVQAKPTALTGPATVDPTFGGATLTGTINPMGQNTSFRFHYALSVAELEDPVVRKTTPTQPLVAGSADVVVSFHIPSGAAAPPLQPGVTYYYRLIAQNATGTTIAGPLSFFTGVVEPPPPLLAPSAVTGAATDVTVSGVTLAGTVNPNGQETTFTFEFGLTTAYGTSTQPLGAGGGTAEVPATAALINLQPGTLYHYRLVATNATGTTAGADQAFTTAGIPPPPPPTNTAAPIATTGPATGVGTRAATLTGIVNPNGIDSTYAFQWGTTVRYGRTAGVATAPAGAPLTLSTPLTGLRPGVTYHYRLVASNSLGSVVGADMTFRTTPVLIMTRLRAAPPRFRSRCTAAIRPCRIGTRLSFSLSGRGRVNITVTRPAMNNKICIGTGPTRRCFPAPSTGAHVVQRMVVRGRGGNNTVLLTGRPGGKPLKAGEYFVTAQGTAGPVRSKRLRLVLHVVG